MRPASSDKALIRGLTYAMFMMFALTTDSVGVIIPKVISQFHLSLTAASAFHYVTMAALGLAGIFFGHLADRLGHKRTIIAGLLLFSVASFAFALGQTFGAFLILLSVSGIAIGIFKTGALALIGDICDSTDGHTATMNTVEGFFGLGGIIGPAIVAKLLTGGASWKWLYVIAGGISIVLMGTAGLVRYPNAVKVNHGTVSLGSTIKVIGSPFALVFSLGLFLYVCAECAIYVWMPTLLQGYTGRSAFFVPYALAAFFLLRAAGRFLGVWLLAILDWETVLAVLSGAILLCFAGSLIGGLGLAVYLLPLSGLFMSMIYPTINSKGISCFPRSQHGAVSGVFLFFTCVAAAAGPLAMGAVGDAFNGARSGFALATGFAGLLFVGLLLNRLVHPSRARLIELDVSEYQFGGS